MFVRLMIIAAIVMAARCLNVSASLSFSIISAASSAFMDVLPLCRPATDFPSTMP